MKLKPKIRFLFQHTIKQNKIAMNSKIVFFLSILICQLSNIQATPDHNTRLKIAEESTTFDSLIINSGIVMPKDSLDALALVASVNGFLSFAQENSKNKWVLTSQAVETQVLIDEIQDIQKSKKYKDDHFFKPYLTKITPLEKSNYAVHIAYIGSHEGTTVLRANFELIAHKIKDQFLISSPLKRKTQHWQTQKVKNRIFYYPYTLDLEKVDQYGKLSSFYDEKLNNNEGETHFYLSTDEMDPLKLFGVEYKFDYNGRPINSAWISSIDKKSVYVLNANEFYDFDPHDLWHNRLRQVISRKEVHRRVDCHIATLYGGIWGKSWDELFPMFYEKYFVGKQVDWLEHKKNYSHFITNEKSKNYTDDFIGALLVKKIEKEKGFDGVWKLLKTKRTKEEEEYFAMLDELIGISKKNYNKEVTKLIKAEIKKFH